MGAVFTQQALDGMGRRSLSERERRELIETVERVARNPAELGRSADVVELRQLSGDTAFMIRAGTVRAIVAVDVDKPEQVVVISIFRKDETQSPRPTREIPN